MKQGLVIVDVQNDYFLGGKMELVGMDKAAANCAMLLDSFRDNGAPIFHIQHIANSEGASFFIADTRGSEINEAVMPLDDEVVVVKHLPSAFRETNLNELLQDGGVGEVVICGAMTHMCIDSSTRAAFDLGYRCRVISDACATRNLEFNGRLIEAVDVHASFMAALGAPFAQISATGQYLSS